jgi:pyruvate dehydrogenase E2 component (dihydrolipoamide acetyltransferase)
VLPLVAAAGVRAIALDLPGHGLSDKPEGSEHYTLVALANAVGEVLDALDLQNVTMVGHSMGGPIAAWVAAEQPGRVRALTLLAPVGFGPIFPLRFIVAITPKAVVPILPYAIPRGLVWLCLRASHGHLRRPSLEDAEQYWAPSQFPGHVFALRTLLHEFDWKAGEHDDNRFERITAPTVILCGSEDHVVLPDEARRYGDLIRGARVVVVDQAGHAVTDEAPARSAQAILSVTCP